MDHFCYLWFVYVMLSGLFIVAICSSAGKGLASLLSCMLGFIAFLSLSHVVFWFSYGTGKIRPQTKQRLDELMQK